jgi:pilus assembly protein CpaC
MKKKQMLYMLTCVILLFFSSLSFAAITTEVILGKEAVITLKKPCIRVSVADPDVAGVSVVSPSEIVVTGKRAGVTSLIIWDKEGNTFFDVKVIADVKEIQKEINAIAPNDNIQVSFANDTIVLSGTASNRQTINKASTKYSAGVTTTETSSSGKVLNLVKIQNEQQVVLQIKVAQIDKTKLKELGISYIAKEKNFEFTAPGLGASPTGNLGGSPGGKLTPGIGGFDLTSFVPQIGVAYFPGGVAAVLQALQTKGYSKILAEPNLVVRSGEKGEFQAGSEIPIQVITGTGANATVGVDYKKVGVMLNFAPEVLDTGAIRLKIDPAEVSAVTSFISFQGVVAPQIDTRNVRTSVDLREGESLVLAGLLSEQDKKNMQKIPILGDIPILGALFRSTSDDIEQTELAFFITPKLVKPIAPGVRTELPTDKAMTSQEEKEFQWIPWPSDDPGHSESKGETGQTQIK